ncbi:MAG: hypothetical protein EA391_12190 [Balneolaceae bacterium]|nr:MAG: hypothetical protein EA391_12190 [Balneolaceae bacterium]
MKKAALFILGFFLLPLIIACEDETASADIEEETIGVFLQNTGSSDLVIREVVVTFCYETGGCVESNVSNFSLPANAGSPLELGIADAGQVPIGAIVTFQAVTGQGAIEIQQGLPLTVGDFETIEILKFSEFQSGEFVTVTYGETNS